MVSQMRWLLSCVLKGKYESDKQAERREQGICAAEAGPANKERQDRRASVVPGKRGCARTVGVWEPEAGG